MGKNSELRFYNLGGHSEVESLNLCEDRKGVTALRAAIILRLAIMVCFPIYVRYKPQRLVSVFCLYINRNRFSPIVD